MDGLGYDVEWQTLNTKDFGIPQNRERVYTIGHLRKCGSKQILPITSTDGKDSNTKINIVGSTDPNKKIQQRKYIYGDDGLMGCLTATDYKEPKIVQIGRIESDKRENPSAYRVYDSQGLSPCLNTMQGGGREPHVLVKSATMGGTRKQRLAIQSTWLSLTQQHVGVELEKKLHKHWIGHAIKV